MERITIGIKINKAPGMIVNALIIQNEALDKNDLDKMKDPNDPSLIAGEITVSINFDSITVVLRGVGEAYSKGTFNLTLEGADIFKNEQDLLVQSTGRFDFFKTNVKLP